MSRRHSENEILEVLVAELEKAGVPTYTTRPTRGSHVALDFSHKGRLLSYVFNASNERHAMLNCRSQLRRMLAG